MTTDDLRQIIGEGDLVLYDTPSFRFEGIVTGIDYEADLVTVETKDYWGAQGWELVAVQPTGEGFTGWFKRFKPE